MLLGMPFIEQELQEEAAQYEHVTYEIEEMQYFTSEEEIEEEPVVSFDRPKSGISQRIMSAAGKSNSSLSKSLTKKSTLKKKQTQGLS